MGIKDFLEVVETKLQGKRFSLFALFVCLSAGVWEEKHVLTNLDRWTNPGLTPGPAGDFDCYWMCCLNAGRNGMDRVDDGGDSSRLLLGRFPAAEPRKRLVPFPYPFGE